MWQWPIRRPKSKYRNQPCCVDGIWFVSKKEGARYGQLKLMLAAGTITNLRMQVPYRIDINGQHICTYKADFVYRMSAVDLTDVVEDCKGMRTREYVLKRKLMAAVHGINILES